jgi:hypothetical protein
MMYLKTDILNSKVSLPVTALRRDPQIKSIVMVSPVKTLEATVANISNAANLPLLHGSFPLLLSVFSFYQAIYSIGPSLSSITFPKTYPLLRGKAKLEWDENVPSFIQAVVICCVSARALLIDTNRHVTTWQERVWGYSDEATKALTVANGYFYWHLLMMLWHRKTFGWAMVAHAVAVTFLMTNCYVSADFPPRIWTLIHFILASSVRFLLDAFLPVRNFNGLPRFPIYASLITTGRHANPDCKWHGILRIILCLSSRVWYLPADLVLRRSLADLHLNYSRYTHRPREHSAMAASESLSLGGYPTVAQLLLVLQDRGKGLSDFQWHKIYDQGF